MARISKVQLIKLQKSLRRDAAIGARFGITRQAVHQLRDKYGIVSVNVGISKRNKEIVGAYKAGKTVVSIAKRHGLTVSYTYRILREGKTRSTGKKSGGRRK